MISRCIFQSDQSGLQGERRDIRDQQAFVCLAARGAQHHFDPPFALIDVSRYTDQALFGIQNEAAELKSRFVEPLYQLLSGSLVCAH